MVNQFFIDDNLILSFKPMKNSNDLFSEIMPVCVKTNEIINEVFLNNERIMELFVKDLFLDRLQVF